MISRFYARHSRNLVVLLLLSQPLLIWLALSVRSNNDIETWMPESSPARQRYEEYKRLFGVEEFILIGVDVSQASSPSSLQIESLCGRLERLPGIRRVTSPDRMRNIMLNLQVPAESIEGRLRGLLIGKDGRMVGVAASLSEHGLAHRTDTVKEVRETLSYCKLDGDRSLLAGSPLFVSELDRLGGKDANAVYFVVTLAICLALLYYLIREWRLTGLVYAVTLWTINTTTVVLDLAGVPMNFVLSSIPVLTMVLTMSISVHYLYYYQEALEEGSSRPLARALQLAWWPTCIATVTTCIGELALSVSDLAPIRQFAYASSFSSVMAMVAGLGFTPALLAVCPTLPRRTPDSHGKGLRLANAIVSRSPKIVWATVLLTIVTGIALHGLKSDMTVSEFLPKDSKVKQDFLRINRELTSVEEIQAVVDCGQSSRPFVEKLDMVRRIEALIQQHPSVDQTMSLTRFFPDRLPDNSLQLAMLLQKASQRQTEDEFTARGQKLWRIAIRIRLEKGKTRTTIIEDLEKQLAGQPVILTGMAALVDSAQQEIFDSFCQSVLMALGLITIAMMVFLKSIWKGILTMIPNVAPLVWVYGMMSWLGQPVDIAIMLSGSIALGMSVDGTFHFMSRFRHHYRETDIAQAGCAHPGDGSAGTLISLPWKTCPAETGARNALLESSIPFIQATLTATAGMFGLTLSSFAPTARFGWVMIALMLAALGGDVLMLPALLHITHRRRQKPEEPGLPANEKPRLRRAA